MNRKGQIGLMIGLLTGFMVVTMLMTLLPGFVQVLDNAKGSDSLNCAGYVDTNMADGNMSYNATIGTKSTIACLGLSLYLPYLVLAVLIGVVVKILYDKASTPSYGGNQYG